MSAFTKPAQGNPLSFRTVWLGQTSCWAPLPAEERAAAVSSHRLPHHITSTQVPRRDVTRHLPTFLPIFLARLTATAGAEAGLSNLSGKQKFLKKTIAFVARFPFSHRLLPIVGGISQMVAYVLDAAGLKFKIFHLPGPCLFLKRRFNNRKNNCSSFLPEWHNPSYSVSEAKPHVGSKNCSASSLSKDLGYGKEGGLSLQCTPPCSRRKDAAFNAQVFRCQMFCKGLTQPLNSKIKQAFLGLSEYLQNKVKGWLFSH